MSDESFMSIRRTNDLLRGKMASLREKTDELGQAVVRRDMFAAKTAAKLARLRMRQANETLDALAQLLADEMKSEMPETVPWAAPQRRAGEGR